MTLFAANEARDDDLYVHLRPIPYQSGNSLSPVKGTSF